MRLAGARMAHVVISFGPAGKGRATAEDTMAPRGHGRFERIRRLAPMALLAGALACTAVRGPGRPDEALRAEVAESWASHIAAAQRKDLAGVMAIYAEDAVYSTGGAPEVRGLDAIRRVEAESLAGADVLDARHTTHDLRVFGDAAFELGTIEGPVRPRGAEAANVVFRFMALWRRDAEGRWRVAHFVGRAE